MSIAGKTFLLNEYMLPVIGFSHHSFYVGLLPIVICCLLAPSQSYADDLRLQSLSMRARVSEKTLLGEEAPENFEEYDVSANFELPWERYSTSDWGVGTRLMASTGMLRGAGEKALVVSLIPELTLGSEDGRFILDLGAGGALFSRHRFGTQDYGGPFQFALTVGVGVTLYKNLGLGYRFLHYSDAGVNGSDTTGADFHMIELSYRFRSSPIR
ncbi:acyloxyacyl hydrolase [Halomonas sp. M4R1S46]|uniref:acyloxyacyl hydrolase n=1 Tax=Halomonas sp. M4R1S46 TaxID=2982692 RepID=UPI0021E359CA|nr:acyloxyacyl hydrolase [Halomonas sp. M4R1S46]UYG09098.1 acyloxyacyl hydrolase [Halomonas sp. M4R1S46]